MINKIIVMIILIAFVCPISIFSQPSNLTDREVLIQMYEKITFIEETTRRIDDNSHNINEKLVRVEGKIIKNEIEIKNIMERIKGIILRWNTLLGMFSTFILGIFVWMWRSVSYRKNNAKAK